MSAEGGRMTCFTSKYVITLLIGLCCITLAATMFNGCGGGATTAEIEDVVDTAGDDSTDAGAAVDDPIAHIFARIAINAALKIGLGFSTDDPVLNRDNIQMNPSRCGGVLEPPPGGSLCDIAQGETYLNCPEDCGCGDDNVCDAAEAADGSCPDDCRCGNNRCDEYAGESSETCPQDCQPVCGDDLCSMEEFFTHSCAADCGLFYSVFGSPATMPTAHGMPTQKCFDTRLPLSGTVYRVFDDADDLPDHELSGHGLCGYGYGNDDSDMTIPSSIFIDFTILLNEVPLDGFTITCTEEMYDGSCLEGMALFVFKSDGTLEFHTALSGKAYAYSEAASVKADDVEAYIVVGATSSGTIKLPPPGEHKTCVEDFTYTEVCPELYRYGDLSIDYDVDGDGSNDYHAYYRKEDGSTVFPADEVCQSFQIDWTLIAPDWLFGPPDMLPSFIDEDGGGASCDDPLCAEHPFCQMSYCIKSSAWNYHGYEEHADCNECGDGKCNGMEQSEVSYCAEDCCGNGLCTYSERNDIYCPADCCGDGRCSAPLENAARCPIDCS